MSWGAWQGARLGNQLELAAPREQEDPQDASCVYQERVELALDRTSSVANREAMGRVRRVRSLLVRLGREAEFGNRRRRVAWRASPSAISCDLPLRFWGAAMSSGIVVDPDILNGKPIASEGFGSQAARVIGY